MSAAPLGWLGILRLGLVQTALGAVVVLTTATLNRVMVIELSLPATLPGALVALHYAVQALRPRLGYGSDVSGRRTPWIVGGMAVLAGGGVLAAVATAWMATDVVAGIALAVAAFILIGLGVGAAGTSLLALLASQVEPRRRAAAATTVWLMMIAGFVVTAAVSGRLLDPFSPERLVAVAAVVAGCAFLLACLAVWGVEPAGSAAGAVGRPGLRPADLPRAAPRKGEGSGRLASSSGRSLALSASLRAEGEGAVRSTEGPKPRPAASEPGFRDALREVWAEPTSRHFTVFVFVSMLAYSAQDLILEPFAGAVFGLTLGESTRLSGVQNGGVFVGMLLVALAVSGGRLGSLRAWTVGGCIASAAALASLSLAGAIGPGFPLAPAVFGLGLANGAFAVAAIGSMMGLAGAGHEGREGTRMGLWGAAQALAFGLGGFAGTLSSDVAHAVLGAPALAYGVVFAAEGALFLLAAALALRVAASDGMAWVADPGSARTQSLTRSPPRKGEGSGAPFQIPGPKRPFPAGGEPFAPAFGRR